MHGGFQQLDWRRGGFRAARSHHEQQRGERERVSGERGVDSAEVGTIWTGVVAMSIYHVVVYGVNQMMVQRTLAARTLGDAKKAYITMGYVAFLAYVLFFGLGVLFYAYYDGRTFGNENLILLEFVASVGIPGLMGIVAAAMSSLDSSLNSMATVTTLDFYEKFAKKDGTPEHYLKASRWFTLFWAVLMVLSKVGSFFVGAKLAMVGLGFFSKHASERGLLIGVAAGFLALWYVEVYHDIAWPWYCALGGVVSIVVEWVASVLLDGFQAEYSEYAVQGQKALFAREGREEKEDGWYVLAGKVDRASYWLLGYFFLCVIGLAVLQGVISCREIRRPSGRRVHHFFGAKICTNRSLVGNSGNSARGRPPRDRSYRYSRLRQPHIQVPALTRPSDSSRVRSTALPSVRIRPEASDTTRGPHFVMPSGRSCPLPDSPAHLYGGTDSPGNWNQPRLDEAIACNEVARLPLLDARRSVHLRYSPRCDRVSRHEIRLPAIMSTRRSFCVAFSYS